MKKTTSEVIVGDSKYLSGIKNSSVELVVTSPPYPMIAMWDEIFCKQDERISKAFEANDGALCFELMHKLLDSVWCEIERVLIPGGIACINIGDATRSVENNFQLFDNRSRIVMPFVENGMQMLPNLIWRKQTNSPNKFMGSGMLSPGGYVTLEHEHILIFRKGRKREFKTPEEKLNRSKSAYFWEERNTWFSDVWVDIRGIGQKIDDGNLRNRSGAFPFDIAYRLIQMFSVKGDTVVDPFLGTGTTAIAAVASQRNCVGFEIDSNLLPIITEGLLNCVEFNNNRIENRIKAHLGFVEGRKRSKLKMKYKNEVHGFPVMTKQEIKAEFCFVRSVERLSENSITANYRLANNFE